MSVNPTQRQTVWTLCRPRAFNTAFRPHCPALCVREDACSCVAKLVPHPAGPGNNTSAAAACAGRLNDGCAVCSVTPASHLGAMRSRNQSCLLWACSAGACLSGGSSSATEQQQKQPAAAFKSNHASEAPPAPLLQGGGDALHTASTAAAER